MGKSWSEGTSPAPATRAFRSTFGNGPPADCTAWDTELVSTLVSPTQRFPFEVTGIMVGDQHPPLSSLLADYARVQQRHGIAPGTIRNRRYTIRDLARHLEPTSVLAATTRDLEAWLDATGVTNRTKATYIGSLRSFYAWATAAGHLPVGNDPTAELVAPKFGYPLPRPIADEDLASALDGADDRMLAILSLMAYEGLRCVEVSRLRGEDIDARAMVLRLWGKGDKHRIVPLHPHTLAALRAYRLPAEGPIFVPHSDPGSTRAISPNYVSQLVSAHLPRHWTAHKLRHWFGTHFYRECKDLLLTQEMMGHSRPETTSVYARADVSKAAAVVGALAVGR